MSVSLMTLVWRMDIATTDKMVLLALADAANDDGVTWIALRSKRDDKLDLLKKCSLSQRAIQMALRRLEEAGFLNREEKPGRGVIYTVRPEGVHDMRPSRGAPDAPGGARRAGGGAPDAPKPSTNHQSTVSLFGGEDDFETFWRAYPNKKAKPRAAKSFAKAIKRADIRAILDGLERAKLTPQWTKDRGAYIPHPSTWLNDEGWNDTTEVEPDPPGTKRLSNGHLFNPAAPW